MTVHILPAPTADTYQVGLNITSWCHLGGNKYLVGYVRSGALVAQVMNFNGESSPTMGAARAIYSNALVTTAGATRIIRYGSDRAIMIYARDSAAFVTVPFVVNNDDTITEGTATNHSTTWTGAAQFRLHQLSDTLCRLAVTRGATDHPVLNMTIDANGSVTIAASPVLSSTAALTPVWTPIPGTTNTFEFLRTTGQGGQVAQIITNSGSQVSNLTNDLGSTQGLVAFCSDTRGYLVGGNSTQMQRVASNGALSQISTVGGASTGGMTPSLLIPLDTDHVMAATNPHSSAHQTTRIRVFRSHSPAIVSVSAASSGTNGLALTMTGLSAGRLIGSSTPRPNFYQHNNNTILVWLTNANADGNNRLCVKVMVAS